MTETYELCQECNGETGKAGKGDGSLYCPDCEQGPFCWDCYEIHCPRLAEDGWRYHALPIPFNPNLNPNLFPYGTEEIHQERAWS